MASITIEVAQASLPEIIRRLTPGDEVMIVENDRPVARLTRPPAEPANIPRLGTLRGTVLSMEHFDEPLEDFREYVE